ncbi:MAG TPA: hypothetical protein VG125_27865 [Pirellulales bacterium]|nr:hypothetical protein [Pirellulales bacterium]
MRRPWMAADGSAAGAGGIGAASPAAGAGAAPSAGAPAPQPPQQLEPQQLEPQPPQPLCFLNRLAKKLQRFFLQQLSQELQQLVCSQQAGSQAGCSQQAASQQVGWQQLLPQPRSNRPRSRPNRLHLRPQPWLQQLVCSQQAGSQQAGCSQQAASQAGWQQAGCSQQVASQAGWQQLVSQQDGWQQLPPRPNILVSRSKPKLWLHRPKLTTSAPTNMFHFIEQRLLYMELGRNACPSLASQLRRTLFALFSRSGGIGSAAEFWPRGGRSCRRAVVSWQRGSYPAVHKVMAPGPSNHSLAR